MIRFALPIDVNCTCVVRPLATGGVDALRLGIEGHVIYPPGNRKSLEFPSRLCIHDDDYAGGFGITAADKKPVMRLIECSRNIVLAFGNRPYSHQSIFSAVHA